MRILGVILAREGSKRLPGKNTKLLNGKPLIEYTIDAAIKSGVIDTLVVSTDDLKIIQLCEKKYRPTSEKPVLVIERPKYLATDNALSEECILHVMDQVEKHDYVMLLQPTSPLREVKDINIVADSIITHTRNKRNDKVNGAIYQEIWDNFYKNRKFNYNKICAYYMPEEKSIDIDTELDFRIAEMLLKERK